MYRTSGEGERVAIFTSLAKHPKAYVCQMYEYALFLLQTSLADEAMYWGKAYLQDPKNCFFEWGYLQGEAINWVGLSTGFYGSYNF